MEAKGKRLYKRADAVLHWAELALGVLGTVFLVAMTVLVFYNVVTRYVFNRTVRWSDEVALLFMIWFGFIGVAVGVRNRLHLGIEFFVNLLPLKVRRWIASLEHVLIGLFGWFMLRYGWEFYQSTKFARLPATQWSRGLLALMVPVSGIFVMLFSLAHLVRVFIEPTSAGDGDGGNQS